MRRYLLSVIEPSVGDPPSPQELADIAADVAEFDRELREAGVWVFSGGLFPPATATVLRPKDGGALLSDGPFVEGKEHLGGFCVIDVEDLDEALEWAGKAMRATRLPIEVRPFR
ncbi:YciI family protein [Dactylosporangium sp. NPDC050688]|uniref:YciI family protein n=1 Tax=Dactylosporangium sp. NPDC050688 TaxID=3157217 RepID=UPI0033CEA175